MGEVEFGTEKERVEGFTEREVGDTEGEKPLYVWLRREEREELEREEKIGLCEENEKLKSPFWLPLKELGLTLPVWFDSSLNIEARES